MTISARQAFKVQRGTTVMASGSTVAQIFNFVDYELPGDNVEARSFIRLTNTRHAGMGRTTGGWGQGPDDFGVYISNPANLGTSISFARVGSTGDCRITWEIISYVGLPGGPNEIAILQNSVVIGSTNWIYGANFTPSDVNRCWSLITSQGTTQTALANMEEALFSAFSFNNVGGGVYRPWFARGVNVATTSAISYVTIDMIGANWSVVDMDETSSTGLGTTWTTGNSNSTALTATQSWGTNGKGFCWGGYRTTNSPCGLDDSGDAWHPTGTQTITLYQSSTTGARVKGIWVIANDQASSTARNLNVQSELSADDTATSGGPERSWTKTLTSSVDSMDETSLFATCSSLGTGTSQPRGSVDYRLTAVNTVTMTECDSGQPRRVAIQAIEWPEDEVQDTRTGTCHSNRIGRWQGYTVILLEHGDNFGSWTTHVSNAGIWSTATPDDFEKGVINWQNNSGQSWGTAMFRLPYSVYSLPSSGTLEDIHNVHMRVSYNTGLAQGCGLGPATTLTASSQEGYYVQIDEGIAAGITLGKISGGTRSTLANSAPQIVIPGDVIVLAYAYDTSTPAAVLVVSVNGTAIISHSDTSSPLRMSTLTGRPGLYGSDNLSLSNSNTMGHVAPEWWVTAGATGFRHEPEAYYPGQIR